jgi:hypothetical protein
MEDLNVRSDSVDVEQIMQQIRRRIREKRGVDYTEEEIRELASVRLERFLDPSKVRSGLLDQFREMRQATLPEETYEFGEDSLYASHRLPFLRTLRRVLNPLLRLFVNPNALIRALHLQSRMNDRLRTKEQLDYEIMSNLVLELTRLSIEVKNLKMRVESLSTRLDFDEHRARALEGVVQIKPGALAASGPSDAEAEPDGGDEARARRRRRRRGRRRGPLPPFAEPGVDRGAHASGGASGDEEAGEPDAPARAENGRAPDSRGSEAAEPRPVGPRERPEP